MIEHELDFNDSVIDIVVTTLLDYLSERADFEIKFVASDFTTEVIEQSLIGANINVDLEFPESPLEIENLKLDDKFLALIQVEPYCIRTIAYLLHLCSDSRGLVFYRRIDSNEFVLRVEFK